MDRFEVNSYASGAQTDDARRLQPPASHSFSSDDRREGYSREGNHFDAGPSQSFYGSSSYASENYMQNEEPVYWETFHHGSGRADVHGQFVISCTSFS